jgi:hypothetical protein
MGALINLTGKRVGRLTVQRRTIGASHHAYWFCLCDCGNTSITRGSYLVRGRTQSCGCLFQDRAGISNARLFRDLTGQVFGYLRVIDMAFRRGNRFFWECRCRCGGVKILGGKNLKSGATTHCGCVISEQHHQRKSSAARKRMRDGSGRFLCS